MQKTQKIFKSLSMKGALDVYMLIYAGCKTEYYLDFQGLIKKTKIKYNALRRITNNLSRAHLIKSIRYGAGRGRLYIVSDKDMAEKIYDFMQ